MYLQHKDGVIIQKCFSTTQVILMKNATHYKNNRRERATLMHFRENGSAAILFYKVFFKIKGSHQLALGKKIERKNTKGLIHYDAKKLWKIVRTILKMSVRVSRASLV